MLDTAPDFPAVINRMRADFELPPLRFTNGDRFRWQRIGKFDHARSAEDFLRTKYKLTSARHGALINITTSPSMVTSATLYEGVLRACWLWKT